MVGLKRWIYGLPALAGYRERRARSLADEPRPTRHGFLFASTPLCFEDFWERQEQRIAAALLPHCSALVDVGAYHGYYSVLAAHLGKAALAIEPDPANRFVLNANLERNGLQAEIVGAAVASAPGTLLLYGDGDTASLLRRWQGVGRSFRRTVPATTLDSLLANRWLGAPLLVKIDVEGAEDAVVAGATAVLERTPRPWWLIESYPRYPTGGHCPAFLRLFETMFAAGYQARLADEDLPTVSMEDVRSWDRDPLLSSNFLFHDPDVPLPASLAD